MNIWTRLKCRITAPLENHRIIYSGRHVWRSCRAALLLAGQLRSCRLQQEMTGGALTPLDSREALGWFCLKTILSQHFRVEVRCSWWLQSEKIIKCASYWWLFACFSEQGMPSCPGSQAANTKKPLQEELCLSLAEISSFPSTVKTFLSLAPRLSNFSYSKRFREHSWNKYTSLVFHLCWKLLHLLKESWCSEWITPLQNANQ